MTRSREDGRAHCVMPMASGASLLRRNRLIVDPLWRLALVRLTASRWHDRHHEERPSRHLRLRGKFSRGAVVPQRRQVFI